MATTETPSKSPPTGGDGGAVEVARGLSARTALEKRGFRTFVSLLGFVVLWEIFARLTPPFVAPTWGAILEAMAQLRLNFILVTGMRVIFALIASFFLGIALAVLLYSVKWIEEYTTPIVKLVMAVPVICWVIFTILWFSRVEWRIAFVLIVVCAPIFLIDILDAMKGVPKQQREMVRSFRPSRWQYFRKLMLPATVPGILTSWKVNISLAIRVVTIAELVGAVSGIGYGLVIAKELFSVADVFAWTILLVVMLLLANGLVDMAERRLLSWRD